MKAVRVSGSKHEVLSVELKDVLNCLADAEKNKWGLLWLHAMACLGNGKSMVDYEQKINHSEAATKVFWKDLVKLSTQIIQTIDIVIIGDKNGANIIKYSTDEQMFNSCRYVIELIDSSYWLVHSSDDNFIENLFDKLAGVEYYNR